MPAIARIDGYRVYFYSHEPNEPPHVHIDRAEYSIKVWLDPVSIARNAGFRPREQTTILRLVETHRDEFLERWNEFFGPQA
jgi:hypothetical protein